MKSDKMFERFCKEAQYDPDFEKYFIFSHGHKFTSDDTYELRMMWEKQEALGYTKYKLNKEPPKDEDEN